MRDPPFVSLSLESAEPQALASCPLIGWVNRSSKTVCAFPSIWGTGQTLIRASNGICELVDVRVDLTSVSKSLAASLIFSLSDAIDVHLPSS